MRPFIQDLAAKHHFQPTRLLEMLREIQARDHHVSNEAVELLAEALRIPRTRLIDAIEFYSFFSSTPKGRYELRISDSITDKMLGKDALIDYLSEKLRVPVGGVRSDGLVSLDNTSDRKSVV